MPTDRGPHQAAGINGPLGQLGQLARDAQAGLPDPSRPLPHSLGAPADDGKPDPDLEHAIAAWAMSSGDTAALQRTVVDAFRKARVYIPAVSPERDRIGMIALRRSDGMTAIAVFTGIERLTAWKPEARPLPHIGSVVAAMAKDDGHTMCVVDLDGPITVTLPIATILG